MNVTIHSEHLQKFVKAGFKSAETHSTYNAHLPLKLRLLDVSGSDIDIIEKVMRSIGDLKSKIALANIKVYRDAAGGSTDMKIKNLKDFVPALRGYIKNSALGKKGKFIVLKQEDDADLYLPYACTNIVYHPPRRTRDGVEPPYVTMHYCYYKNGTPYGSTEHFSKEEVVGKSCPTILRDSGWTICNDELMAKYLEDVKRFGELAPQIGLKCLARGTATSTTTDDTRWWSSTRTSDIAMEVDGKKSQLVIDIKEKDGNARRDDDSVKSPRVNASFWYADGEGAPEDEDGDDLQDDADDELEPGEKPKPMMDAPLHPYIHAFDLTRHDHLDIHVRYLEPYRYDPKIGDSLILPKDSSELISALVGATQCDYEDIIAGKSGGTIIMCSGEPGTGKTLTAECYSEVMGRPLYSIQSSQLGTTADELEEELKLVLTRAMRWKAILLIDEADVFIHERGDSIEHNAVVGIFLRVLEYYSGVLFLTTNRATIIDDAIASRCTAHVTYAKPDPKNRLAIWNILSQKAGLKMKRGTVELANKEFSDISGRDIKNLLKLSNYMSRHRKQEIDIEMLKFAKRFSMGGVEAKK